MSQRLYVDREVVRHIIEISIGLARIPDQHEPDASVTRIVYYKRALEVIMTNRINISRAALVLGVCASTLRRWRRLGIGPAYSRLGPRRISYSLADLDTFLVAARVVPGDWA